MSDGDGTMSAGWRTGETGRDRSGSDRRTGSAGITGVGTYVESTPFSDRVDVVNWIIKSGTQVHGRTTLQATSSDMPTTWA